MLIFAGSMRGPCGMQLPVIVDIVGATSAPYTCHRHPVRHRRLCAIPPLAAATAAADAADADAEWRGSWVRDSVHFRRRDGITDDTKKFMMFCWNSALTVRNRQKHPL